MYNSKTSHQNILQYIRIQSEQAISNFVHDITSSDVYNKLNQSPTADPNVNYNMLHDVIKLAKDKHMPYKTVKFNKYKHKKSTWITLAILKSIRYRDKLRNKLKLMHAVLVFCRAERYFCRTKGRNRGESISAIVSAISAGEKGQNLLKPDNN